MANEAWRKEGIHYGHVIEIYFSPDDSKIVSCDIEKHKVCIALCLLFFYTSSFIITRRMQALWGEHDRNSLISTAPESHTLCSDL